jgi:uncharacterized protein YdaU (DUF1376 family)
MHYYKKNIGDYHKKAGRLSILQHGAYNLLIDSCYDRESFPTIDEAIDWVWASSEAEVDAVKFVLKKFFHESDGVYIQSRIQDDLEKYQANSVTNKRIAIERERKRKETGRDANSTKRAGVVNDSINLPDEATPNYKPLTINQEPLTNNQLKEKTTPVKLDYSVLQMTEQQSKDVVRIRRKNKGTALTQLIINQLAKQFFLAAEKGFTFDDSLIEWEVRGWKSFKAEWMKIDTSGNGQFSHTTMQNIETFRNVELD